MEIMVTLAIIALIGLLGIFIGIGFRSIFAIILFYMLFISLGIVSYDWILQNLSEPIVEQIGTEVDGLLQ